MTRRLIAPLIAFVLLLAACTSDRADDPDPGSAPAPPADAVDGDVADPDGGNGDGSETEAGPAGPWADHSSEHYEDPARWLCLPGRDDICSTDLDATVIRADGTHEIEPFVPDPDADIDCFYVYPTISRDETGHSDWDASPDEEGWVTVQQAARLGAVCRVHAPVYRQRTLTGLMSRMAGENGPDDDGDPYADVLDAFRTYLAHHNDGRDFVLIGHSQGAGLLTRLLAEEFDDDPTLRDHLVAAYLAGSSVAVPAGATVGADLDSIPLCTEPDETACIVTWSTYGEGEVPETGGIFGRTNADGDPAGCVNPAAIESGDGPLRPYLPAARGGSILGPTDGDRTWLIDGGDEVTTPFVMLPDLIRGTCRTDGDLTYLEIRLDTDADDRRITDLGGRLTPDWGLHLLDVNLVMGDLVDDIATRGHARSTR